MAYGVFRTVWITLRAQNYTARAFDALRGSLGKTLSKEEQFARNTKRYIGAVGLMFVAMGLTAVNALVGIIQKSTYGAKMMEKFSKRVDKALARLGGKLARALEPILNVILGLIEFITALPFGEWLLIGATGAMLLGGALVAVAMAIATMKADLPLVIAQFKALIAPIMSVTSALWAKAAAWVAAHGPLAPVAAAIAIGAAAGVTAYAATRKTYQMGTSFVQKGGLAVVHGGEEIKSARESRVPSLLERVRGPAKRIYQIRFDIGTLNTKASKEEMVDVIREAMRSVT